MTDQPIEVSGALAGERIDRVVAMVLEVSRARAADLIAEGRVAVDGTTIHKPSVRVESGQRIELPAEDRPAALAGDPSVDLDIRYVDADVVVIEKAAGQIVHPGSGVETGTVVQGLLARFPEMSGVGERDRPGIVHRLDKGTSGLLMAARSALAHRGLGEQLRNRQVARTYLALVHGLPTAQEGLIDAPIGRSLRHPTRQAVRAGGKDARTFYTVEERFEDASVALLRFRLETGRTHQIRVHADAIGHPLVGDDRYGVVRSGHPVVAGCPRLFLHAGRLGFQHPRDGRWLEFTSDLPTDLASILSALRGR